jgi:hypothetical protein
LVAVWQNLLSYSPQKDCFSSDDDDDDDDDDNYDVAISPDMLDATFAIVERPAGLCLQADGNQFQHSL